MPIGIIVNGTAVILGTVIGFAVHLGDKIQAGGLLLQKGISAILPGD